ncbi:26 kDa periplasmic immunogenic protein [bioreactor metagenome]|uniref:26 kDa periplasmic immunogenic protein n=1 Tax=bioreactor metagenome TaxID=1076179 RepID=A0A645HA44_9ZZZZ
MNNVYEALSSLGISRNRIKTVTYSISPRYNYRNNVTELAGYNVTNAIQVTITNLKKVSSLLDMTVKQGINQSNSISFGITDEERNKIYLQALAQAVANAKEKAVSIAAAAGIKLSQPSSIIEGSQERPLPLNYRSMDMAKMEMGSEPTAISEGELKVEANVTVIYDY